MAKFWAKPIGWRIMAISFHLPDFLLLCACIPIFIHRIFITTHAIYYLISIWSLYYQPPLTTHHQKIILLLIFLIKNYYLYWNTIGKRNETKKNEKRNHSSLVIVCPQPRYNRLMQAVITRSETNVKFINFVTQKGYFKIKHIIHNFI